MATNVIEFLAARLRKEEALARAAQGFDFDQIAESLPEPARAFVLAHCPERVLADCESRSIILDVLVAWRRTVEQVRGNLADEAMAELVVDQLLQVVHPIAGLFSDHPDWDATWGAFGLDA